MTRRPAADRGNLGDLVCAGVKPDRRRPARHLDGTGPNSRSSVARRRGSSHARGRDASMSAEPTVPTVVPTVVPTSAVPVHVGIDVAKARLDVCLLPGEQTFGLDNSDDGIARLVALLQQQQQQQQHTVALVLLEATGRHERRAASALLEAGFNVAVVNPRQARDFARARWASWPRPTRSTRARWRSSRRSDTSVAARKSHKTGRCSMITSRAAARSPR